MRSISSAPATVNTWARNNVTPHSIREITLDEIILEEIRRVTSEARKHTAEFVRFISQKSSSENRKELNAKLSEQGKLTKRNEELNLLFKRLYEDNVTRQGHK